jgi:hypothetical protein
MRGGANTQAGLVEYLCNSNILKTARVRKAMLAVDRRNFVPDESEQYAYVVHQLVHLRLPCLNRMFEFAGAALHKDGDSHKFRCQESSVFKASLIIFLSCCNLSTSPVRCCHLQLCFPQRCFCRKLNPFAISGPSHADWGGANHICAAHSCSDAGAVVTAPARWWSGA